MLDWASCCRKQNTPLSRNYGKNSYSGWWVLTKHTSAYFTGSVFTHQVGFICIYFSFASKGHFFQRKKENKTKTLTSKQKMDFFYFIALFLIETKKCGMITRVTVSPGCQTSVRSGGGNRTPASHHIWLAFSTLLAASFNFPTRSCKQVVTCHIQCEF